MKLAFLQNSLTLRLDDIACFLPQKSCACLLIPWRRRQAFHIVVPCHQISKGLLKGSHRRAPSAKVFCLAFFAIKVHTLVELIFLFNIFCLLQDGCQKTVDSKLSIAPLFSGISCLDIIFPFSCVICVMIEFFSAVCVHDVEVF